MSTYGAILGASIGVILLCLVVMVACYVLYAVSHMKALKALGYKNAWLAWIPYGVFYACADAAAEGEALNFRQWYSSSGGFYRLHCCLFR